LTQGQPDFEHLSRVLSVSQELDSITPKDELYFSMGFVFPNQEIKSMKSAGDTYFQVSLGTSHTFGNLDQREGVDKMCAVDGWGCRVLARTASNQDFPEGVYSNYNFCGFDPLPDGFLPEEDVKIHVGSLESVVKSGGDIDNI